MKHYSTYAVVCVILLAVYAYVLQACKKSTAQQNAATISTGGGFSAPLPVTKANEMIQSYLDGIDYTNNTSKLRSLICDADSLRAYLQNPNVKYMKLFLAHTEEWITSGHRGQRPGVNQAALTIILAGVDSIEKYVPYSFVTRSGKTEPLVLDRLAPCPDDCVGSDLITDVE